MSWGARIASWGAEIGRFVRNLPYTPMGRAAVEITFAVLFTFAPILLLSIPFSSETGVLSREAIGHKFYSFWASGELILPILAVCASIASVTAVNHRSLSKGVHVTCWAALLVFAIGSGFALSETDGFSVDLYPTIIRCGFFIYGFLLLLWFIAAVAAYRGETAADPEKRVDDLLKGKAAAAAREAGHEGA